MKKDKVIPALAIVGIGLAAAYMYSQAGAEDLTGTEGWSGGGGTSSLTPITTTTTETIPIGGGGYPQIVLPAIQPYAAPAIPAGLFPQPALPQSTETKTIMPMTKKPQEEPSTVFFGKGFGGGGVGGRGDDDAMGATIKSGFDILSVGAPFNLPLSMSKIVSSYISGSKETKKTDTTKLSESWAGPLTGITAGGGVMPVTLDTKKEQTTTSSGTPAPGTESFFSAGKDYGTPTGSTPAAGGGTTYHYASGAYQTVQQGQIVSAGSAGSTTPPVRYSGQTYAAPGTAAGGSTGRVYSKKAAKLAGLI